MFSHTKRVIIAAAMVGAVGIGTASSAVAARVSGDTDDHFNVPAGTKVTATGSLVASGVLAGVNVTVTCTSVTAFGKTPTSGLTISVPAKNISISGCTTNPNVGSATFKLFGTWKLAEIDATNDETATEPNLDHAKLVIPKVTTTGGAEFFASAFPSCIVHVADGSTNSPSAIPLKGTYNDAGALKFPTQAIHIDPVGCPSGTGNTGNISSTLTANPAISDVS